MASCTALAALLFVHAHSSMSLQASPVLPNTRPLFYQRCPTRFFPGMVPTGGTWPGVIWGQHTLCCRARFLFLPKRTRQAAARWVQWGRRALCCPTRFILFTRAAPHGPFFCQNGSDKRQLAGRHGATTTSAAQQASPFCLKGPDRVQQGGRYGASTPCAAQRASFIFFENCPTRFLPCPGMVPTGGSRLGAMGPPHPVLPSTLFLFGQMVPTSCNQLGEIWGHHISSCPTRFLLFTELPKQSGRHGATTFCAA